MLYNEEGDRAYGYNDEVYQKCIAWVQRDREVLLLGPAPAWAIDKIDAMGHVIESSLERARRMEGKMAGPAHFHSMYKESKAPMQAICIRTESAIFFTSIYTYT